MQVVLAVGRVSSQKSSSLQDLSKASRFRTAILEESCGNVVATCHTLHILANHDDGFDQAEDYLRQNGSNAGTSAITPIPVESAIWGLGTDESRLSVMPFDQSARHAPRESWNVSIAPNRTNLEVKHYVRR